MFTKRNLILLMTMAAGLCMTAQPARQSVNSLQKNNRQHVQKQSSVKKYAEILQRLEKKPTLQAPIRGNDWWEPDTIVLDQVNGKERGIFSYNTQGFATSHLTQTQNGQNWDNSSLVTCSYDAGNRLLSSLNQLWENNSWINTSQYAYTYDGQDNLTTEVLQSWDGSGWINSEQYAYTYDENNNVLTELYQEWEDGFGWENENQTIYTYNENNNVLTELSQIWDDAWMNEYLDAYTYSGDKITHTLGQTWDGDDWINEYQVNAAYDGENLSQVIYQAWTDEQWMDRERMSFTYDGNGNLLTELVEAWTPDYETMIYGWEVFYERINAYDSNNNRTEALLRHWNFLEHIWKIEYKTTYRYDPDNNAEEVKNWYRADEDSAWEPTSLISFLFYNNMQSEMEIIAQTATISYIKVRSSDAVDDLANDIVVSVFPNPTTGELRIENGELKIENVEVFDVMGKKLSTFNFQLSTIDVSHLPTGVYFVRIKTGNGVHVRKVVKQ